MLSARPLTIARGRGGKYPSQHDHCRLHGELGNRWDQTQDFSKKMTKTFYFILMGYEELNRIWLVSLGQFRRFNYHSKALNETNSKLRAILKTILKIERVLGSYWTGLKIYGPELNVDGPWRKLYGLLWIYGSFSEVTVLKLWVLCSNVGKVNGPQPYFLRNRA